MAHSPIAAVRHAVRVDVSASAGLSTVTGLPARLVPVAPQVDGLLRHDDEVGDTGFDVVVATRTRVALDRLKRMDEPNLDVLVVA
jgi:hypothetical protein